MRMRAVAALAAVALLAGCTATAEDPPLSAGPPPDAPAELAAFYRQDLLWQACGSGLECARLRVPVDYQDPGGSGEVGLEVVRAATAGRGRIGSLVVNPGGPGASGADYARAARAIVSEDVLRAYDIVGFDPRGVGASEPVDCVTDGAIDALLAVDPTPDSDAEVRQLLDRAAALGAGCLERSGGIAAQMDTVTTARDLDILRSALGDERLHYLGKSFGTAIGSVYAEQFPARVGRMVLDGAFPVSLGSSEISLGQARGFELALQRFAADCVSRSDCPLRASTAEAGVDEVGAFLASLEQAPLPAGRGRELTEALGSSALLYHLYFPPGDWAQLRQGLGAAFARDGSVLLAMLDNRLQRDPTTGRYANNSQEAFYAVSCLDRPAADVAGIERQAAQWRTEAPTFGPYLAWSDAVCAQWPLPPVAAPREIRASGAEPVLVVSTQYDPATPYAWGPLMAEEFDAAALVSYNGDGHTAYRNGSACVDAAVDDYLIDGALPDRDPRCGY